MHELIYVFIFCALLFQSYRRPLNPTDPNSGSVMIECGLPAAVGGIGGGAKLPAMVGGAKVVPATPAESETKEKKDKKGTLNCGSGFVV